MVPPQRTEFSANMTTPSDWSAFRIVLVRLALLALVGTFFAALFFVFPLYLGEDRVPSYLVFIAPVLLVWFCRYVLRNRNLGIASFGVALLVMVGMLLPFACVDSIVQTKMYQPSLDIRHQLRQIALALHNYHDTHGTLPPAAVRGPDGRPLYSWRVLLLPFIDQEPL